MKFIGILSFILASSVFAEIEIVAHRGVHQTYHRENLTMETCTANRIDNMGHRFLENTLESMKAAFRYGATTVELDVHPTTEETGPEQLVVFHDWGLKCRTDASCETCKCNENKECVTNQQSWEYISRLDIGYGYTFDNGASFPFRGRFSGKAPRFEDTLRLLQDHPDKFLLVNVKGNASRTTEAFLRIIAKYPDPLRSRVLYPRGKRAGGFDKKLDELGVKESIYQGGDVAKACLKEYILTGMFGHFPEKCKNRKLFIPIRQTLGIVNKYLHKVKLTSLLWGWPDKFIERAHQNNTKIYPSQIDSLEELNMYLKSDIDGLMTNRIEIIGPALKFR